MKPGSSVSLRPASIYTVRPCLKKLKGKKIKIIKINISIRFYNCQETRLAKVKGNIYVRKEFCAALQFKFH